MADQTSELFSSLDTFITNHPGPKTNPHNLKNNCVFATMAYLMGMSLDDFLNHIEEMQPRAEESGIPVQAITQMLESTKRECRYAEPNMQGGDAYEFCLDICEQWGV